MIAATNLIVSADTVAIVVHGVGDHTATDIIGDVREYLATSSASATPLELTGFPPTPNSERGKQVALQFELGGGKHVLIPVVWSRFRLRVAKWADQIAEAHPQNAVIMALPAMLTLVVDALRCFPRARGWWKLALLGLVAIVVALIAGVAWLAYFAAFRAAWVFGAPGLPNYKWYSGVIWLAVFIGTGLLIKLFARLFDFVGDVAAYVGRDSLRSELQSTMDAVIRHAATAAPNATILVVGHSLGSVLVASSAAKIEEDPAHPACGRTVLVTLGSPIDLLSRVFPKNMPSAKNLFETFVPSRCVSFWVNFWRDSDFIGRSLHIPAASSYAQVSLGKGPHWGMWNDARVWAKIEDVLRSITDKSADRIRAWQVPELNPDEQRELSLLQHQIKGAQWTATIWAFISLNVSFRSIFVHPLPFLADVPTRAVLSASWVVAFASLFVFFNWCQRLRAASTSREALGKLRLVWRFCLLAGMIPVGLASGILWYLSAKSG